MDSLIFHRYPFLRLLLPWIVGIICGDYLFFREDSYDCDVIFLYSIPFLLLGAFLAKQSNRRVIFLWKVWFFISIYLLSFAYSWSKLSRVEQHLERATQSYEVLSLSEVKRNNSVHSFLAVISHSSIRSDIGKKLQVSILQDSVDLDLPLGSRLYINGVIKRPTPRIRYEFDYGKYLVRKGELGTIFAPSAQCKKVGSASVKELKGADEEMKSVIVNFYRSLKLPSEEVALLSALTLGERRELTTERTSLFTDAGVSHLLALSGLHVGVIFFIVACLFRTLFRKFPHQKIITYLMSTLSMWFFAYLTGFSPSVVRSVLMFSILGAGKLNRYQSDGFNQLFATAFIMLVVNPMWLYDVGFQLSFIAVFSLLLGRFAYHYLEQKNRIVRYILSLLWTSLVAQLGTLPLILYYFGQFPTYFLLANLLIIPLITFALFLAVIALLCSFVFPVSLFLAKGIHLSFLCSELLLRMCKELPGALIKSIYITGLEASFIYFSLFLFLLFWATKSRKLLFITLLFPFFIVGAFYAQRTWRKPDPGFYYVGEAKGTPVFHCYTGEKSYMIIGRGGPESGFLYKGLVKYSSLLGLPNTIELYSAHHEPGFSYEKSGLIYSNEKSLYVVPSYLGYSQYQGEKLSVDYLYIHRQLYGNLKLLTNYYWAKCVYIGENVPDRQRIEIKQLLEKNNLRYVELKREGYTKLEG